VYRNALADALVEEVNLRLAEHARHFYNIVQQVSSSSPAPQHSSHGAAARYGSAGSRGAAGQGPGPALLGELQARCARQGLQYCPGSALTIYVKSKQQQLRFGKGNKRGRNGRGKKGSTEDAEASGSDAEPDEGPQRSAFLTLGGNVDRRKLR
jgi:hypothetical protein